MKTFRIGRFAVRQDLVALVALLVVGLLLGLGLAGLLTGEPRVSQADYAVLVAQVYQRDHSAEQAKERLQAIGIASPADTVADLAQQYPTSTADAAQDAQSLRDLAQGLGRPVSEATPVAASPQVAWLLPLLMFFFIVALGSLLVFRILGVKLPRLPQPAAQRYPAQARRPAPQASTFGVRQPQSQPPPVVLGNSIVVRRRPRLQPLPTDGDQAGSEAEVNGSVRPGTASQPRTQFRFRSSYHFGDDPYDEIHPIADPRTGTLVGACGVTAYRQVPGPGPVRYWGFTAWVQDYVGKAQQLKAIGIVSKWAYLNYGDELDEWLRSGQIDELKQVDSATLVQLETGNFAATLKMEEFEYGEGTPPEAYFTRLAAQFDVALRAAPAVAPGTVGEPT